MNKKVVVFGGAGFLGSHVCDSLTNAGYRVSIYDVKESPYVNSAQEMIIGDVRDEELVKKTLNDAQIVYNFSGISDIDECAENVQAAVENNILGHTIILDAARRANIERLVFASSVYVYSKHGSVYTITKQACEQLTEEYKSKYGLNYTVLRYGSLYGPRSQMWNGVYRYLYDAVTKGKIDYPGTGEEKRRYIHVTDAARLSVSILDKEYENRCVIITGNNDLTSKDLFIMVNEMLNNKVTVDFLNEKHFHHYAITPYSFIPRTGMQLTPNPSIDMGEGILRQIEEIYKDTNVCKL